MPQEITIYWDGSRPVPPVIDTLPDEMREAVLQKILERMKELQQTDPTPIFISVICILIFFVGAALYSNRVTKRKAALTHNPGETKRIDQ